MPNRLLGIDVEKLKVSESYWTAKEIEQQPLMWKETAAAIENQRAEIDAWLDPWIQEPNLRIVLSGAGTSAFAGDTIAPWLRRRMGRRIDAVSTTDIVSDPTSVFAEDVPTLMVSFARSGDSPESIAAVEIASDMLTSCCHMIVTCNASGKLAKGAENNAHCYCLVMPNGSNDRGFAMTSSFTSMLIACATALVPAPEQLERAAELAEIVIQTKVDMLQEIATRKPARLVFLGTGPMLGIAREAALKSLELSAGHVVSLYDSPLGFRHGPKAIVNDQTLIFLLRSSDPHSQQYDDDLFDELIKDYSTDRLLEVSSETMGSASADDELDPFWLALPCIVFCQIFAFFLSQALQLPSDNPFPDGKVNRVVKGVRIIPHVGRGAGVAVKKSTVA